VLGTAPALAEPALWRLADDDTEIWMFGTMHVLPAGVDWRTERLNAAIDDADVIYLETPVDDETIAAFMPSVLEWATLPEDESLSAMLPPEGVERLRNIAKAANYPFDALDRYEPWFVSLMIANFGFAASGQTADHGVETGLLETLTQGNSDADLAFLETPEAQIRPMAELPRNVQVSMLMDALMPQIREAPRPDLMELWLSGDQVEIEQAVNGAIRDLAPALYDVVLVRRNLNWTIQIEDMLEQDGVFLIAAGAAHFPGPDGVVTMLRNRGHVVEGP
tara:strand:- start:4015 stop:4848 length:834 start_codon:yes stop_codon:yes gene_type:complete